MNKSDRYLLLPIVIAAAIPVLAACDRSATNSTATTSTSAQQADETDSDSPTSVASQDTVNIVVEAEPQLRRELEDSIRAIPEEKKRFSILLVPFDSRKTYRILKATPDPTKKYSILVFDPQTNEQDQALTEYFGNLVHDGEKNANEQ